MELHHRDSDSKKVPMRCNCHTVGKAICKPCKNCDSHTTDQKTVGVGPLLGPISHFDAHLNFEAGAQFILGCEHMSMAEGHVAAYALLRLCDSSRHDDGNYGAANARSQQHLEDCICGARYHCIYTRYVEHCRSF